MTHIKDILNQDKLQQYVIEKFISVRKHPSLPLLIYNYTNKATFEYKEASDWPHEVRVCRGLITDLTGNIVARPFRKFFNIGQEFDWDYFTRIDDPYNYVYAAEKLDGWFGVGYQYEGTWGVSSRGSFTSPGAEFATNYFQKVVETGAISHIPEGYTPVFEIICKQCQIVVPYNYEGLVLLALINNKTGDEFSFEKTRSIALAINKIVTGKLDKVYLRSPNDLSDEVDTLKYLGKNSSYKEEGFILVKYLLNRPPVRAKVKYDEYCRIHKLITGVHNKQVHAALANPLKQFRSEGLPKEFNNWINKTSNELFKSFDFWVGLYKHNAEKFRDEILTKVLIQGRSKEQAFKEVVISEHWKDSVFLSTSIMLYKDNYVGFYKRIWELCEPDKLERSNLNEGSD